MTRLAGTTPSESSPVAVGAGGCGVSVAADVAVSVGCVVGVGCGVSLGAALAVSVGATVSVGAGRVSVASGATVRVALARAAGRVAVALPPRCATEPPDSRPSGPLHALTPPSRSASQANQVVTAYARCLIVSMLLRGD